ncbi:MAG: hypothetical protein EBU84_08495 [Actinobacteria bacterium]|nr:hypothetical protein [Actinomycetota bacterium]
MSTPDARTQAVLTYCNIHAHRSKFYADLLAKFTVYGELTIRQLEAVERSMAQDAKRLTAPVDPVTETGMYENDEGIFRVKRSRENDNLYAMRFYPTANTKSERFVYEKGAVHKLRASDRMTVERARELGAEMSVCCVCGADLTDAKSVAKGIGPVCEKKV